MSIRSTEHSKSQPLTTGEFQFFRDLGWHADRWAITTASLNGLEVFASLASNNTLTFREVIAQVHNHDLRGFDREYLARLARIVAVRPSSDPDTSKFVSTTLKQTVPKLPKTPLLRQVRTIAFDVAVLNRDFNHAKQLLDIFDDLRREYFSYRVADLQNPFLVGLSTPAEFDQWLELFNKPFTEHDMLPIDVALNQRTPFERVHVQVSTKTIRRCQSDVERSLYRDHPLVTVILTAFNPDTHELQHSISSILNQTWTNLELIVVNDASADFPVTMIRKWQHADARLKLINLEHNGGTYRARNIGLRYATGSYITGQDSDDWSHPERLELQLRAIHNQPQVVGVLGQAIRADENLVRTVLGFQPNRRCEVSLMYRLDDALKIGGYLEARKAADSEFKERLAAVYGNPVIEIPEPIYLTRLSRTSLSRSDFRHGWTDEARVAFGNSFRFWHKHLRISTLGALRHQLQHPTVATPQRISGTAITSAFDVCIVCDWRAHTEVTRGACDELRALTTTNLRIAIIQLVSPFNIAKNQRTLLNYVQRLINDGKVTLLDRTDEVEVKLLIVRDPSVVMYSGDTPFKLSASSAILVAEDPTHFHGEYYTCYTTSEVELSTYHMFGLEAHWQLPVGVNEVEYLASLSIDNFSGYYPSTVHIDNANNYKQSRKAELITILHDFRPEKADISTPNEILTLNLLDSRYDNFALGTSPRFFRNLRMSQIPTNWITFPNYDISITALLKYVDCLLFIDSNPNWKPPRRIYLEALATHTPIIAISGSQHHNSAGVWSTSKSNFVETVHSLKYRQESRLNSNRTQAGARWLKLNCSDEIYLAYILKLLNKD